MSCRVSCGLDDPEGIAEGKELSHVREATVTEEWVRKTDSGYLHFSGACSTGNRGLGTSCLRTDGGTYGAG